MRFKVFHFISFLIILSLTVPDNLLFAQKLIKGTTTRAVIYSGDTIPYIQLKPVSFYAPRIFKNQREARRYSKLVRNVKKVYPYARLAGIKYQKYSEQLAQLETEFERKKMAKQIENEVIDMNINDISNIRKEAD
jgi:hypothetical protein